MRCRISPIGSPGITRREASIQFFVDEDLHSKVTITKFYLRDKI